MGFEIKKHLNRILLAGLLITFFYGVYYSYQCYICQKQNEKSVDMESERSYEDCMGSYSEERMDLITALTEEKQREFEERDYVEVNPENSPEFLVFQKYQYLYSKADICRQVKAYREQVVKNAARLKKSRDTYYARVNKKIEKMYSRDVELVIHDGSRLEDIAGIFMVSEIVDFVNIVLLVIVSCSLFLIEHRKGTFTLVYSSYRGRGHTYAVKLAVAMGFAVLLSLLQTVSMVLLSFTYGNLSEWKDAIQNIEFFIHSPYHLNLAELVVVVTVLRALGYLVLICIFTVISVCFQKNIIPLAINTLIGIGGFGLCYYFSGSYVTNSGTLIQQGSFYSFVRMYSPFVLIGDGIGYLKKYEPLNILNYPVSVLSVTVLVNIVLAGMIVAVGYPLYIRRFRRRGV